jgi:hypothetical protein
LIYFVGINEAFSLIDYIPLDLDWDYDVTVLNVAPDF